MNMQRFVLSVAVFFSVSAHSQSLTLEDAAKAIDPSVLSVFLCGHWQHGQERGQYRVISGWIWGHTELYVQWLADPVWYPEKGQTERRLPLVLGTLTIPELNDYNSATDLENVQCVEEDGQWMIRADAEDGHEEPASVYTLTIRLYDEPGRHDIEQVR